MFIGWHGSSKRKDRIVSKGDPPSPCRLTASCLLTNACDFGPVVFLWLLTSCLWCPFIGHGYYSCCSGGSAEPYVHPGYCALLTVSAVNFCSLLVFGCHWSLFASNGVGLWLAIQSPFLPPTPISFVQFLTGLGDWITWLIRITEWGCEWGPLGINSVEKCLGFEIEFWRIEGAWLWCRVSEGVYKETNSLGIVTASAVLSKWFPSLWLKFYLLYFNYKRFGNIFWNDCNKT